jgi:hypothetical protein
MNHMAREQSEAGIAVERDLEAVAKRSGVPRGYDVADQPPVAVSVHHDAQSQTVTIRIGPARPLRPAVTRLERGITASYDMAGRMAVIEIAGAETPTVAP